MQFRQMRHFIVVAEELHMHRAAERLNIAQPALSQQIKALEERLGVTLFSRANRRLTLTPAGEAFLVKARLAISLTEQAVLDARQTARGEQGELNLGCVSSAMFDGRLPAALRQMHSRWPAITMSLMTAMLLAATMSSTDSASVFNILRSQSMNLKHNLRPMLELESGSNDPMAYMLTIVLPRR